MRIIITLLSALISFQSLAQEIAGRVIDEKKEPMVIAVVQVYAGGILKGGTVTDYDGNYVIKQLEPGYYELLAIYTGYDSSFSIKVLVSPDARTTVNFGLLRSNGQPKNIIKEYKRPLVQVNETQNREFRDEIRSLPGCGPTDLAWSKVGVYQVQRGTNVNIGNGSISGTQIGYDCVQVATEIGIDYYVCAMAEIETVDPDTFVLNRYQLSRMVYRDLNDLLRSIPENTQYGFENSLRIKNIRANEYSYIVDGMHLLSR